MALHYCKKCGRVVEKHKHSINDKCDYCNSDVYPVPEKYWLNGKDFLITKEQEKLLREELVKTAPEFDPYLFEHRDADLSERSSKIFAVLNHGEELLAEERRKVTCSYCGSSNVRKVGFVSRAVSAELWGLGSKKIGKQWHCNSCGSDF